MRPVISFTLYADALNALGVASFRRGFMLNLRMNLLLAPDSLTILNLSETLVNSTPEIKFLQRNLPTGSLEVQRRPLDDRCAMMLWRMAPVFDGAYNNDAVYCRDLDAMTTAREWKIMRFFQASDSAVHSMTDSVSHNIALMGGMTGWKPDMVVPRLHSSHDSFGKMMREAHKHFDLTKIGSDQEYLGRYILPDVLPMMMGHYIKGGPHKKPTVWFDKFPTTPLPDVDPEVANRSDDVVVHMGQAGFNVDRTASLLLAHGTHKDIFLAAENLDPKVFYWNP